MPDRFTPHATPIAGLFLVERHRMGDERGFLGRIYCADALTDIGFADPIVQINQTMTRRRGTIRGLHFQYPPHAENKFVSVIRGAVFDVAVDLRAGSPTFLHWHGAVLSADNARSLFIPKGFAHGLQTLEEDCEMLYLHTARYHLPAEDAINAFDPRIGIDWPLAATEMSAKDRTIRLLDDDFTGVPS